MRIASIVCAAASVVVAVAWHGGYSAGSQWAFAALAGAAAALAFAADPTRGVKLVTEPAIVVLLVLGWLAALSGLWTIGIAGDAYRAGALAAGYGALALATAILSRGAPWIALAVGLVAAVTALLGLLSVALLSDEFAARLSSLWQAQGTFGYPPALALVQIAALPLFLTAMLRSRTGAAALAAGCAALAGGVVVLAANRMTVALALVVVGLPLVLPRRTVGSTRTGAAAAAGVVALAALAIHLAFGGHTSRAAGGELGRTLLLVVIAGGSAAVWPAVRRAVPSRGGAATRRSRRPAVVPVAVAALAAVAILVAVFTTGALGERFGPHGSFTHGRLTLAHISADTFAARPLQGYGAGAYLRATLSRQEGRKRITLYAHDLPLEEAVELGVLGLLLAIALYLAAARALWRAGRDGGRSSQGWSAIWLLGPAVASFLLANLVDWSWHIAGVGAVFALALGGIVAAGDPLARRAGLL